VGGGGGTVTCPGVRDRELKPNTVCSLERLATEAIPHRYTCAPAHNAMANAIDQSRLVKEVAPKNLQGACR